MSDDTYEAFVIRCTRVERPATENVLGGDPHDAPMPLPTTAPGGHHG